MSPVGRVVPVGTIASGAIAVVSSFPTSTFTDTINPLATIIDGQTELSGDGDAKVVPRGAHHAGPVARLVDLGCEGSTIGSGEHEVRVSVEGHPVVAGEVFCPFAETGEAVVQGDHGTFADAGDVADDVVGFAVAA